MKYEWNLKTVTTHHCWHLFSPNEPPTLNAEIGENGPYYYRETIDVCPSKITNKLDGPGVPHLEATI